MGNAWSQKVENNGEIWNQSFRNAKGAAILGLCFTLLKFRRALFRLYLSFTKSNQQKKKNSVIDTDNKNEYKSIHQYKGENLYKAIFIHFARFPTFILVFSILFKKLIRMNYLSTAMDINLSALPLQKYSISFMAFLLTHYIQQNVAIFHWKWTSFLLIRSLYGLIRLSIPEEFQIFEMEDIHSMIFPFMGCLLVCHTNKFVI